MAGKGEVRYRLTADPSGVKKGVGEAKDAFAGLSKEIKQQVGNVPGLGKAFDLLGGSSLKAAGAVGAVAAAVAGAASFMAGATRELIAYGGAVQDLSNRYALSLTTVQAWRKEAEVSGISIEDIGISVKTLAQKVSEGDDSFRRLGMSVAELRKMRPEEQFKAVGKAILEVRDPTQQAAAAVDLMGKGGMAALQAIRDGFLESAEAAKQFSLPDETIKDADRLGDSITRLKQGWKDFKMELAGTVAASGLTELVEQAAAAIRALRGQGAVRPEDAAAAAQATGLKPLEGTGLMMRTDVQGKPLGIGAGAGAFGLPPGVSVLAGKLGGRTYQPSEEAKAQKAADDAAQKAAEDRIKKEREYLDVKKAVVQAEHEIYLEMEREKNLRPLMGGPLASEIQTVTALPAPRALEGMIAPEIDTKGGPKWDFSAEALRKAKLEGTEVIDVTDNIGKETIVWHEELQSIGALMTSIGGAGGPLGQILGGVAGIGQGLDAVKKAGGFGDLFKSQGKGPMGAISGVLGGIGVVGSMAASALGIGKAIVGLFKSDPVKKAQKEAGQALGHGISHELAEELMKSAKEQGKSIAQVAREYEARIKAEQRKAEIETLRGGVETAKQGAQDLLGLMDELSPKAQAAGAALVKAVQDAMVANGLGYLATGELAKSKEFAAVQSAVGASSQIMAGMRTAGGIDTSLLANSAAMAEALKESAVEAALAAGVTGPEAERAGMASIAPLLTEMLNSSIASGQKLSEDQKALLEEAKKNGISIVADPLLQQLDVQKEQLSVLRQIAGGGGPSEDYTPTGLSSAGGYGEILEPKVIQPGGARFLVHEGEGVLVVPRSKMSRRGQFAYVSAAGGFYTSGKGDERERERRREPGEGPGGGGGGGDTGEGGETGIPTQTGVEELERRLAEVVKQGRPLSITTNVAPQITEDPLATKERKEDLRKFTVEQINRVLKEREPETMFLLRRGLGIS